MGKKYDFLVVGAGIFGATCARLLTELGWKCLIIDRDKSVGGMCQTERQHNIDVHLHGPHVFHTNNVEVWNFVNRFSEFNHYKHIVLTLSDDKLYHMPFSMNTFNELYGLKYPADVRKQLLEEIKEYKVTQPTNLEEQCLAVIGSRGYEKLIKGYSEKLWGRPCSEININVMMNMPIRFTWDTSYFETPYQGIPVEGYTKLIDNIIGDKIDGMLGKTYSATDTKWNNLADLIIYTGPVDMFCNYIYGPLDWRTLMFQTQDQSMLGNNLIGNSVIHIADKSNEVLQVVEHKWFTPERLGDKEFTQHTIVSNIFASEWSPDKYPMYPVNNAKSEELYKKYVEFIKHNFPNVILGGRAGLYRPMSMSDSILNAMSIAANIGAKP